MAVRPCAESSRSEPACIQIQQWVSSSRAPVRSALRIPNFSGGRNNVTANLDRSLHPADDLGSGSNHGCQARHGLAPFRNDNDLPVLSYLIEKTEALRLENTCWNQLFHTM